MTSLEYQYKLNCWKSSNTYKELFSIIDKSFSILIKFRKYCELKEYLDTLEIHKNIKYSVLTTIFLWKDREYNSIKLVDELLNNYKYNNNEYEIREWDELLSSILENSYNNIDRYDNDITHTIHNDTIRHMCIDDWVRQT